MAESSKKGSDKDSGRSFQDRNKQQSYEGMSTHSCLKIALDDVSSGLDNKPQSWHDESRRFRKAVYAKTRDMDVVEYCFKKKICDDLNRDFAEKIREHAAFRPSGVCKHEEDRHYAAHAVHPNMPTDSVSSTTSRNDKYTIGGIKYDGTSLGVINNKRYDTRSSSKNDGASSSKNSSDVSSSSSKDKYTTSTNKYK